MEARRLLIMLVCMVAIYGVSFAEPQVYTISGAGIAPATVPSGATELKGDVKIDTLYFSSDETPVSSRSELIGPPGPKGDRGNTILNGTGAPAAGLGNPGDFYMDTQNRTLYGPKDAVSGWGSGFTLVQLDPNLKTENIKSGVSIFNVSGSPTVIETTSGTPATAGDILIDKTAYVNGSQVNGTVAYGKNVIGGNGNITFLIPDGLYNGSNTATATDINLLPANIKLGSVIFGTTGTLKYWSCTSGQGSYDADKCFYEVHLACISGTLGGSCIYVALQACAAINTAICQ